MKFIYFCGEVVADLVDKDGSCDFHLSLGGSLFYGAMGAARLKKLYDLPINVAFVGPLSNDQFGARFLETMIENKIITDNIERVDRNTILAMAIVRRGQENSFSFYEQGTAEQMVSRHELPQTLSGIGNVCVFGSISTVLEPARFAWFEFASEQKQRGNLCIYDLNTRPQLIKSQDKYIQQISDWAGISHVVKASEADIAWAYPKLAKEDVVQIWLDAGAHMAVITMGEKGSFAATRKHSTFVVGKELYCTNTIGAGDNFNAGLATILSIKGITSADEIDKLKTDHLQEILRFANESSTRHLIEQGSVPKDGANMTPVGRPIGEMCP